MAFLKNIQQLKHFFILVSLVTVLIIPSFVFVDIAQGDNTIPSPTERLENVGSGEGGSYSQAEETTVAEILGTAVKAFLSLLGIIFIILTIVGGAKYMLASGNEERARNGLSMIRHAIIGLIIVVGSYAIWGFIVERFILGR
jgi:hypothetical protein